MPATFKINATRNSAKHFIVLCAAIVAYFAIATAAEAKPQFSALTVDARTGAILYSNDPDGLRHPASLTKMMTLYVLFQDLKSGRIKRDSKLRVSARAASMAPSKLGLKPGSTITVDEAIKALVTKSANDVAATIGENLGGTESNFAARMTRVARSIGMSRSSFYNASGLPNAKQYTTARDMATLGLRLMRDYPQYYPYFRIQAFNFHGRTIRTHNRLVQNYAGTDGIKTGYVAASGYNLVTSTLRGDKRLVGVVLGARSANARNSYMMVMFEKMFRNAKDGTTVAALAGSSKGVINPVAVASAQPKPETATQTNVDTEQLSAAAATASEGPVDTSGDEEGTADAAATTSPKVLQAALGPVDDVPHTPKKTKLPFAVKSVADEPNTLVASIQQSWNIQIGAYPNKQDAQAKLTAMRGATIPDLENKPAFTVAVQKGSAVIYRARFGGFDEASAKQACASITKLREKCVAVQPQS